MGAPEHPKYASDFSAHGCVLHNAGGRTSDPSLSLPGRSWPILRPLQDGPKHKIVGEGASLMHPPVRNKYLISAHTMVSCTMLVSGRLGKVLACPEHPADSMATAASPKHPLVTLHPGGPTQGTPGHVPDHFLNPSQPPHLDPIFRFFLEEPVLGPVLPPISKVSSGIAGYCRYV